MKKQITSIALLALISGCGEGDAIYEELPAEFDSVIIDPVIEDEGTPIVVLPTIKVTTVLMPGDCGWHEDDDFDGVCNDIDNCKYTWNPLQIDKDGDGVGKSCDWNDHHHQHNDSCDEGGPRKTGERCFDMWDPEQVKKFGPGKCKWRCEFLKSQCEPVELYDDSGDGTTGDKTTRSHRWGVCVHRPD